MASSVTSVHEFCLLNVDSLAQLRRSNYKWKVLRDCWEVIGESNASLRLWCEPYKLESATSHLVSIERARIPLYISRSLTASAAEALKILTYDLAINEDDGYKPYVNILPWWPGYIGSKFTGSTVIQDGEVVVWCADPVRHAETYIFIEYAAHSTTLKDFILQCEDGGVIIRFFEETLLSLRDAWKRRIVHSRPTTDNILYDTVTDTVTWCGLSALRPVRELEGATETILTVIAHYYELLASKQARDVTQEVRVYLDAKLDAWRINSMLQNLITSGAGRSIPSNALRLWDRDLDFDSVCESMIATYKARQVDSIGAESCADAINTVTFLEKPRISEGFIYHSLLLHGTSDIDMTDLRSYEAAFEELFTLTKREVKRLLKEGRASMLAQGTDSVDDIRQRALMATADWLTARLLIDGLATRNEYRNSLISDTIANNADQYVIEMKAKLLRITGECELYFHSLPSHLDYETMDTLTYHWDTIRDTMHKLR